MRLLIISNMSHYYDNSCIVGWGPTVQEIDHLAQLFDEVHHIGCLHEETAPSSSLPYTATNIKFIPVKPTGGKRLLDKLNILKQFPSYMRAIHRELKQADVVHVRCPANISLLAIVMLRFYKHPRMRWIKYAGNWSIEQKRAKSYGIQRWWLNRNFHRGLVTINGHWPPQPKHIYSFFNPTFTNTEIEQAKIKAREKQLNPPYILLFIGALNHSKGIGRALEIAAELQNHHVDFRFHIAGDGPEKIIFEQQAHNLGLANRIIFHGWLPKPQLAELYGQAHFLLLPSDSEGLPKVLGEAMSYGTVPIAGAVSCIPQILEQTKAGSAVHPYDISGFTEAILRYINESKTWDSAHDAGLNMASSFTYEYYLAEIKSMFLHAWNTTL